MRRWDGLLDRYVARLKARRPRLQLEPVDADRVVLCIRAYKTPRPRAAPAARRGCREGRPTPSQPLSARNSSHGRHTHHPAVASALKLCPS